MNIELNQEGCSPLLISNIIIAICKTFTIVPVSMFNIAGRAHYIPDDL